MDEAKTESNLVSAAKNPEPRWATSPWRRRVAEENYSCLSVRLEFEEAAGNGLRLRVAGAEEKRKKGKKDTGARRELGTG
jgi:hypothetical protein